MSRRQLIAPFLAGVFLGPPITLLLGFGWELLLISPLIGGVSLAAAALRVHYATNFFRTLILNPTSPVVGLKLRRLRPASRLF
jgi:hypothetical protein